MTFAILCTGPSMSQAVADSVRHLRVIAVNGTYQLAPWAEALAANDGAWWAENPEAKAFAGRRFSASKYRWVEKVEEAATSWCSGVLALEVAAMLGATRVLLLGVDMHGSHYFGDYANLRNTTEARRKHHIVQFRKWGKAHPHVEVLNATPGSSLTCFPMARLEDFV